MKGFALIFFVAGVAVLVNGALIHVGIILLIEGGVLLTLVEKTRRQGRRSPDRPA